MFFLGDDGCSLWHCELTPNQSRIRISSMAPLPIKGSNDTTQFLFNYHPERVCLFSTHFLLFLKFYSSFFAQKWVSLYLALVTSPVSVSPGQWQVAGVSLQPSNPDFQNNSLLALTTHQMTLSMCEKAAALHATRSEQLTYGWTTLILWEKSSRRLEVENFNQSKKEGSMDWPTFMFLFSRERCQFSEVSSEPCD